MTAGLLGELTSRKVGGFDKTQEESNDDQMGKVLGGGRTQRDDTPDDHHARQKQGRFADLVQEQIAGYLLHPVRFVPLKRERDGCHLPSRCSPQTESTHTSHTANL